MQKKSCNSDFSTLASLLQLIRWLLITREAPRRLHVKSASSFQKLVPHSVATKASVSAPHRHRSIPPSSTAQSRTTAAAVVVSRLSIANTGDVGDLSSNGPHVFLLAVIATYCESVRPLRPPTNRPTVTITGRRS